MTAHESETVKPSALDEKLKLHAGGCLYYQAVDVRNDEHAQSYCDCLAGEARLELAALRQRAEDLEMMLRIAVQPPLRNKWQVMFSPQFQVGWQMDLWRPLERDESERGYSDRYILPGDHEASPVLTDAARAALREANGGAR